MRLYIDAGVKTGYAFFTDKHDRTPIHGTIDIDKIFRSLGRKIRTETRESKIYYLSATFANLLSSLNPEYCTIEGVEQYRSDAGKISVSSGDAFFLAYIVGAYASVSMMRGIKTRIILAREWKGQLSKQAVENRVERINPDLLFTDSHSCDAVGMGFADMGML